MRPLALIPLFALALGAAPLADLHAASAPATAIIDHHRDRPLIQVAILLDDSGSMQGLINQARAQLWELVNRLARTTRNGQAPRIEVALYHYGDTPFLAAPLVPLSNDLDGLSERLFTVNGGGGTECCGLVIHNAVTQLAWSSRPDALRLIVIAGNEPFTQGPFDYRAACAEAAGRGIAVHTIHCGARSDGLAGEWAEGARLGGGTFTCIDHNRAEALVAAPQDAELARLGAELNRTYIPFGAQGAANAERQMTQDANALANAPAAAAGRAAAKASAVYENGSWDLVDAVRDGKDLAGIERESLPAELRGADEASLRRTVEEKRRARTDLQRRIAALTAERTAFVAEAERKQAAGGDKTFGQALRDAVDEMARKQGFTPAP